MMTVGSLFAGIGGFDLGLERAGFAVRWQVEIEPYCQAVLAKHWPAVTRYGDIRTVRGADVEPVDVLCGGFPCQDISFAGKGAGIAAGTRSGLWSEFDRLIGELRPRYVIVENVSALLVRGIDRVLGDLATCGYDAEWDCLPASAFGANHQRDRIWLVAYADESGRRASWPSENKAWATNRALASHTQIPNTASQRLEGRQEPTSTWETQRIFTSSRGIDGFKQWLAEPDVGRVVDGIPAFMDRLRGLGNAIVPQIAEWIGRRILEAEALTS